MCVFLSVINFVYFVVIADVLILPKKRQKKSVPSLEKPKIKKPDNNIESLSMLFALHKEVQQEHLVDVFDPKPDGWCGWRATANYFEGNQDLFPVVKKKMLETFEKNKQVYWDILHLDERRRLQGLIERGSEWVEKDGGARLADWFRTPECAQVVADTYGVPVVVFPNVASNGEAVSFLPLEMPLQTRSKPPSPFVLQNISGSHWVCLKFKHTCKSWPTVLSSYRASPVHLNMFKSYWNKWGQFPKHKKRTKSFPEGAEFNVTKDEEN